MNQLVKILLNDDGDEPNQGLGKWHLVDPCNWQGSATLCSSEFFGVGESAVVYEIKESERGGVTCDECNKIIRIYKKVKL